MPSIETERLHDKARHDEAQALYHAKQQGFQKGFQEAAVARRMLADGKPIDKIMKYTGLPQEIIDTFSPEKKYQKEP